MIRGAGVSSFTQACARSRMGARARHRRGHFRLKSTPNSCASGSISTTVTDGGRAPNYATITRVLSSG